MGLLTRYADNTDERSLASRMRRRRFQLFLSLLSQVPRPLKILDVGGTRRFWNQMGFEDESGVTIVLLNNAPSELSAADQREGRVRFEEVVADARDLGVFADKSIDVVFSNSVIEHLPTWDDQRRMMEEVQRVGVRYFIQTPNYYFPVEPHFHVVGFQFLPLSVRASLLQRFRLGWTERVTDRKTAECVVGSVRLLKRRELEALCPGSVIYEEKLLGMTKSLIAAAGW